MCGIDKPFDEFTNVKYKGIIKKRPTCKKCTSLRTKIWVEKNKDKRIEYVKNYSETNKEKINLKSRVYYLNNTDKAKQYSVKYKKTRRQTDEVYRIADNVRKGILKAFANIKQKKNTKTANILGCSFIEFKQHLETQFEPWMTWDNYGLYNATKQYGWDLDHIEPLSSAKTIEDVIRLNHYTNFQPLCSYVNRHIKRNKPL